MDDWAEKNHPQSKGDPEDLPRDAKGRFQHGAGRWKPGQSGNPAGRPKHKTLTEELMKTLDKPASSLKFIEKVARAFGVDPEVVTVREVMVLSTLMHGAKGNPTILNALWDRVDGKVADRIAGHDGGPVQVQQTLSRVLSSPKAMDHAQALANEILDGMGCDSGSEDEGE